MDLEVVVLAAGDGKRMRSALPKVLHEVAGRPILAWVIEAARALEPAAIHVVYRNEAVRLSLQGALEAGSPPLQWVVQPRPLGTGHAVAQALPGVSDGRAVVVICGDVPGIDPASLGRIRSVVGPDRLAILTVSLERPDGYGRVRRDSGGRILGIVEERDASPAERAIREVNTGSLPLRSRRFAAGWRRSRPTTSRVSTISPRSSRWRWKRASSWRRWSCRTRATGWGSTIESSSRGRNAACGAAGRRS